MLCPKDIPDIIYYIHQNYNVAYINGNRGIGKSYYIKKMLEYPNYTLHSCRMPKRLTRLIKHRCSMRETDNIIYISLLGIAKNANLIELINQQIQDKIMQFENIFIPQWTSKLFNKIAFNISLPFLSISFEVSKNLQSLEILSKKLFKKINKDILIVIDDLDRLNTNLDFSETMGVIEKISNIENIKLCLVGWDKKTDSDDIWKDFKDKIIEREYKINTDVKNAEAILREVKNTEYNRVINEYNIITMLDKNKNLRNLKKAVNSFREFVNTYGTNFSSSFNTTIFILFIYLYLEEVDENSKKEFLKTSCGSADISQQLEIIIKNYKNGKFDLNQLDILNKIDSGPEETSTGKEKKKPPFLYNEKGIVLSVKTLYKQILNTSNIDNPFEIATQFSRIYKDVKAFNININMQKLEKKIITLVGELAKSEMHLEELQWVCTSEKEKNTLKSINEAIKNYYLDGSIRELLISIKDTYAKKEYNYEYIEKLSKFILNNIHMIPIDMINNIVNYFKRNQYYIPDFNDELTEIEWRWFINIERLLLVINDIYQSKKVQNKCIDIRKYLIKKYNNDSLVRYRLEYYS